MFGNLQVCFKSRKISLKLGRIHEIDKILNTIFVAKLIQKILIYLSLTNLIISKKNWILLLTITRCSIQRPDCCCCWPGGPRQGSSNRLPEIRQSLKCHLWIGPVNESAN
jgi:hypothetical protein